MCAWPLMLAIPIGDTEPSILQFVVGTFILTNVELVYTLQRTWM